jgi:hypothetical protein
VKALSGYAEWFWLLAKGWKDVENRPRPLPKTLELPARIYLHASKTPTSYQDDAFILELLTFEQIEEYIDVDWSKYRGAIIGEITITGQCDVNHVDAMAEQVQTLPVSSIRNSSKWLFGPYGFWVKDGVLYEKPIPYRGQLGFFEVKLTEGTNVRS